MSLSLFGSKRMPAEHPTSPPHDLLRQAGWVIVVFLAMLYSSTLTSDYYWDGITFALQIEKVANAERGAALLFHQNHLIYNGFGYVLYRITQAFGFSIRALQVLQIANAIAGAIAVGVFYRLAFDVTRSRAAAILSAAALAFSAVWWKLATDANAYIISILLILVCGSALMGKKPSWIRAGLALAGAMLFHQLASLFYPAALAAILANPRIQKKGRFAFGLSAAAWGPTLSAYYVCASLLHDIKDPLGVIRWAASNPSGVSPSLNPLHGIALLPRGNIDLIVGHNFSLYRSQAGWIEHLFTLIAVCTAIGFIIKAARDPRRSEFVKGFYDFGYDIREQWRLCGSMLTIWAGAYLTFLLFWEPWQTLYRAFYLPALALGFALILWNLRQVMGASVTTTAALAIATLVSFNLSFFVLPHMRPNANPRIAAARQANQAWNEATVIYFADRNEADTAFEYFNDKTDWRRLTPMVKANFDDEIRLALDRGKQVWLNKGAVDALGGEWLARRAIGREILLEEPPAPAHYIELR
jgi:hypothetical protein